MAHLDTHWTTLRPRAPTVGPYGDKGQDRLDTQAGPKYLNTAGKYRFRPGAWVPEVPREASRLAWSGVGLSGTTWLQASCNPTTHQGRHHIHAAAAAFRSRQTQVTVEPEIRHNFRLLKRLQRGSCERGFRGKHSEAGESGAA